MNDEMLSCDAGAPELLNALSLKMHTQLWLTTGRGFNGVLGGLSGFSNTCPHAGAMLRTVRAACVRDVCAHDSARGVELVRAVQVGGQSQKRKKRKKNAMPFGIS